LSIRKCFPVETVLCNLAALRDDARTDAGEEVPGRIKFSKLHATCYFVFAQIQHRICVPTEKCEIGSACFEGSRTITGDEMGDSGE
jgi:hypothetical protein